MRYHGKPRKEKPYPKDEDKKQGRRPKEEKIKYRHSAIWLDEDDLPNEEIE